MDCKRCGLCCIISHCGLSGPDETGVCKELVVHEDFTTSCRIVEVLPFINTGCALKKMGIYDSLNTDDIKKIKERLISIQNGVAHGSQ